ncbi:prepilin-type N-terminal cleavage/methylation domain-containing protein [Noviherbaspirillum pedocola]|uniref:Prepilin-type N-terminal cleavage/methylation domain-containing protein n=1 Tax=Noviherbaspirillum pedocola TaxID=2801341 RepID=A0A934W8K5_9BURK|nr:prepilin-type N-terminal cleavage/methylation domain-containing protein [Noviherbaspirillum pedocola]MBK4738747.1 prepilin-type N-terminal cleavage/methylation domain-containing protein [Noviherbaspirillum pedocola]
MKSLRKQLQRGFTLIELAVVVIIIGILLVVIAPSIIGSQTGSKATLILRITDTTANNWSLLASQAGVGTTVASNTIAATPSATGVAQVLYDGSSYVASAYLPAYTSTGIKAMNQLVAKNSNGDYVVSGTGAMTITLAGGGSAPMSITFANVPPEIVTNLIQRIQPSLSLTTDGSTQTVGQMTYQCPSSGLCTSVVFYRPV